MLCRAPRDDLGVVRALRARAVPVRVVKYTAPDADVRDVALAVRDEVVLTDYNVVTGLERRLVIGLGDTGGGSDMWDRLYAMSRCTAQLVWIDLP